MTSQLVEPLLILALALNFVALGVGRIRAATKAVAAQGIIIGLLPLLLHQGYAGPREWGLVIVAVAVKGFVAPYFLLRALRAADIRREMKPVVGHVASLLLAAAGSGLALDFAKQLPLAEPHADLLLVPASLATVWCGFLLLVTRRQAILQVLGYLVLENGVFLFGLLLQEAMPFLVEICVLMDLFTAIFVMGIIIHHINREFATASSERLSELKG